MTRRIVARVIVALLIGIASGYGIGRSVASDAARGRALTMKEYVTDFENYKSHLIGSDTPVWAVMIAGVLMVVAAFGIYELLVWVVDKLLAAMDRRASSTNQPGTAPPW